MNLLEVVSILLRAHCSFISEYSAKQNIAVLKLFNAALHILLKYAYYHDCQCEGLFNKFLEFFQNSHSIGFNIDMNIIESD